MLLSGPALSSLPNATGEQRSMAYPSRLTYLDRWRIGPWLGELPALGCQVYYHARRRRLERDAKAATARLDREAEEHGLASP